ncbi:phage tail tape measure protein [Glaesserella parasuis]|uniref:phage tail tape measure protein n=3 Tax=Glaesserella parasuis TaxID=738 RepID=UPI00135DDE05|nr:phage tail tape measure protein [Glaesserella parasuis]MDO9648946.1 phage tail tape measure protein [Glaesserella parasuis]MDO9656602.1 phage tail tape measure protein [Glaesserella parasuis]MDO9658482.1 phage tail tape measure protein [Glaesserella parasuis]MDO9699653.1 phage tail tape measure protein [Glaesserella parasuis]MDO9759814.1 phage tail tape measure protein [Glaesserella parasuis]
MANELAIGLVIGATLRGVGSAFGEVTKHITNLNTRISIAERQQQRLGRTISRAFSDSSRDVGTLKKRYDQLGEAIKKAEKSQIKLNQALSAQKKHSEKRQEIRGQFFETGAHAMAMGMPVWSSIKTYIDQEESQNNLKIAMMKADGTFGQFNEISKIAGDLGRDLPGTRKDFYNLAQALKKQGISDQVLLGGALKTSAELNVLLDMDQFAGGEFLAKFIESHGLKENELGSAADYLQRAMFAGGLSKEQMYESMKYYAPKLNSLGLTGADNTEKVLAIEALAGQRGLEGSTFGTGFNMMLTRMNKGPEMLRQAKKGMKAEAREMLDSVGIEFNFWDKKGKFKGIEGMLSEMEKFEKIRAKYGDKGVDLVANELFGIEGGRLADILAQKGKKGLEEMLTKMREQASLQERINQKTATLGAALEQLGGVWESAVGTFGSAFAQDIKEFANVAQAFIENTLTPWIEKNKGLIKTSIGIVGGFVGIKMGILAATYGFNLFMSPFKAIAVFGAKVNSVFNMIRLARFGGAATSVSMLGTAFAKAKTAVVWLSRALLTNPIGLAVMGIATAALFIYQYWEPIKGFFLNLWTTIKPYFDNFSQFVSNLWNGISGIWSSVWGGISNWFSGLWENLKSLFSGNFSALGNIILSFNPLALFTTIFTSVLNWFGIDLPAKFSGFGQNIIDGLVGGISNAWNLAKEKVSELGSGIKGWFAEKLGIHSPSRVFKGYGVNVVEGLVIGMDKAQPLATEASQHLSNAVTFEPVLNTVETMFKPTLSKEKGFFGSLWDDIQFGANMVGNLLGLNQPTDLRTPSFNPQAKDGGLFADYQPLNRNEVANTATTHNQGITVHFSPNITITGSTPASDLKEQLLQALNDPAMLYGLEQLLNRVNDQFGRRAY